MKGIPIIVKFTTGHFAIAAKAAFMTLFKGSAYLSLQRNTKLAPISKSECKKNPVIRLA